MEPASAVIGIVSFGFTVFEKVSEIHKTIKGAPQQVQALQDTCNTVEMLLRKLRSLETQIVPHSEDDLTTLKRLCERSQRCLEEVEKVVDKVIAKSPGRSSGSEMKIRLRKWVLNKHDLEDTSKKLKEVREALRVMMDFLQFHYVEYVAVHVRSERKLDSACPAQHLASTSTCVLSNPYRRTGTLQCSHDCTCRCHAHILSSLIPEQLAPYVGQLFISKQLLYPAFTPWNYCNIATCRGTFLKPAKVSWMLPSVSQVFYGSFQTSSNTRIHFSINAYRTISLHSPVIQAIAYADVRGIRELFASRQASIWDVDVRGVSILWYACNQWQDHPSEARLDIVRFLVGAGADALLFADTQTGYSAHDTLALGLFSYLLGEPHSNRPLAISTLQTNSVAIDIFRSILNINAIDALQDLLHRVYGHSTKDVLYLLTSLETAEYSVARSLAFSAIRYTPLGYAIAFLGSSKEFVLAELEGTDAAAEPVLSYAVHAGREGLIELLIEKGTDVNLKDSWGRTALHWACYQCHYKVFFELLRCAEAEIDWDSRTPEGQSALDLLEMGVSDGSASYLTSSQIDEFRAAIISHMRPPRIHLFEDETLYMPGAFPLDPES